MASRAFLVMNGGSLRSPKGADPFFLYLFGLQFLYFQNKVAQGCTYMVLIHSPRLRGFDTIHPYLRASDDLTTITEMWELSSTSACAYE